MSLSKPWPFHSLTSYNPMILLCTGPQPPTPVTVPTKVLLAMGTLLPLRNLEFLVLDPASPLSSSLPLVFQHQQSFHPSVTANPLTLSPSTLPRHLGFRVLSSPSKMSQSVLRAEPLSPFMGNPILPVPSSSSGATTTGAGVAHSLLRPHAHIRLFLGPSTRSRWVPPS